MVRVLTFSLLFAFVLLSYKCIYHSSAAGDAAAAFGSLCSLSAPLQVLLAPRLYPFSAPPAPLVVSPLSEEERHISPCDADFAHCCGNLFTLFLSDPVHALVHLSRLPPVTADRTHAVDAALKCLNFSRSAVESPFAGDSISCMLLCKFALCRAVLRCHVHVPQDEQHLPSSVPPLPVAMDPPPHLLKALFAALDIIPLYREPPL